MVYADLMLWRKFRGGKGTPGEGRIGDIAAQVDKWLRLDSNDRKAGKQ